MQIEPRVRELIRAAYIANAETRELWFDPTTYKRFINETFTDFSVDYLTRTWCDIKLVIKVRPLSSLKAHYMSESNDDLQSDPFLLCLVAQCVDTGRTLYFDDPETEQVYLPKNQQK